MMHMEIQQLHKWIIIQQMVAPTLTLYSPSSESTGSSYRYGDNLMISGGAIDDVGIGTIQIRFTRNLNAGEVPKHGKI